MTTSRAHRAGQQVKAAADATLEPSAAALLGVPADGAPLTQWMAELRSDDDITVCTRTS